MLEQSMHRRVLLQIAGDGGVQAGERAQFGIPVWVGQATDVKDEVRVGGQAVLEAE